jgi:tRNA uridine 5-carboxymethylaminomethyl modification enzyme
LGCVDEDRYTQFCKKRDAIAQEQARLKSVWIQPNSDFAKTYTEKYGTTIEREYSLMDLLRRPEVNYANLMQLYSNISQANENDAVAEQVEIQAKYSGYIARQEKEIEKQKYFEDTEIPDNFDYQKIISLSAEVRQKLEKIRPQTIGQASRISGVTPAAVSLLMVHVAR